jgi:hypothetical protein
MDMTTDHWKAFAMELWGLSVSTWDPIPERAGKLPEPLEYDTIHDGLVELETGERCLVIQMVSGYQVGASKVEIFLRGNQLIPSFMMN